MNQIIIHKTATGYEAEYLGDHANHVLDLFGTRTIPTAYPEVANARVVQRAIHQLNPGVSVDLCECAAVGVSL